jgi:predicted nucleic acid-binding Zn ribbon protein
MPFYEYEVVNEDGSAGERFEIQQRMTDPPLETHPETGAAVRRVISTPTIPGKWSDHAANRSLNDDKRLGELGFTKYVKSGDGTYERRAGKGPRVISSDD